MRGYLFCSFAVGTSCPPWDTRIATRCSETSGPEIPIKQTTTVYPAVAASLRKVNLSPTGSEKTVSKTKLFPLLNEFASQRICHLCGYVRADFQLAGQDVNVYEAQPRRPKMRVIKS